MAEALEAAELAELARKEAERTAARVVELKEKAEAKAKREELAAALREVQREADEPRARQLPVDEGTPYFF